ncbi:unnamed protein product [Lactuca saligna]|uniref:HMA domain-containing protein n=1 Tax=Lactuca saligna TaxID=75948 RepID=A0AA35ZH19_LACSI|nr:unnamed protein product [Lactuca saligna]
MAPPHEKVTKMVLDVDLKCSDCYKKVKKILCKIPEIRDQEYDVEKNKVKITVVCCSPEKIRDKLCHKGGSSIQKIEVVVEKPKDSKPSDKDKPKDAAGKPKAAKGDAPPPQPKKSEPKPEVAKMVVEPVQGYPQMYPPNYAVVGYGYEGYGGSYPPPAPPQPSGYGYGYGYGYGHDHGYNGVGNRHDYFSEENPQGCSVM